MLRISVVVAVMVIGMLFVVIGERVSAQEAETPLRIDRDVPQMFVDDYLIDTSSNLERSLHQPIKDDDGCKPIIRGVKATTDD